MGWVTVLLLLAACVVADLVLREIVGASHHDGALVELDRALQRERERWRIDRTRLAELSASERTSAEALIEGELRRRIEEGVSSERRAVERTRPLRPCGGAAVLLAAPPLGALAISGLAPGLGGFPLWPSIVLGLAAFVAISIWSSARHALMLISAAAAGLALALYAPAGFDLLGGEEWLALPPPVILLAAWLAAGSVALLAGRAGAAVGVALGDGRAVTFRDIEKPREPQYVNAGYRCGRCRRELARKVSTCPHCGVRFGGERTEFDKPPPGPRTVRVDEWTVARSARWFLACVVVPAAALPLAARIGTFSTLRGAIIAAAALATMWMVARACETRGRALEKQAAGYGDLMIERVVGTYTP